MDLLSEIKEARRYILAHSKSAVESDALGKKYTIRMETSPFYFLEALSQIAREKNARVYAYVNKEKTSYELTPSKDKKEVYIVSGNKIYTMTSDYMLIECNSPEDMKRIYNNTPKNWLDIQK